MRAGAGERVAIETPGATLTYAELTDLANRTGNALRDMGVEPEPRVGMLLPDGVDWSCRTGPVAAGPDRRAHRSPARTSRCATRRDARRRTASPACCTCGRRRRARTTGVASSTRAGRSSASGSGPAT
ncbi:MAG: AMP-binding protein [Candidatus Rokubacteria bacterium]|nr:AMP-binding protein [Candidatus Rokubacteria bacterium]